MSLSGRKDGLRQNGFGWRIAGRQNAESGADMAPKRGPEWQSGLIAGRTQPALQGKTP